MNEVIKLLLELQDMVRQGYSIDDAKLDLTMQTLQNAHDNNIDSHIFLDDEQKEHRKDLYKDCVRTMKKYVRQCLLDDAETRNKLLQLKQ